MIRICTQCTANFEITDDDLQFYEKVSPVFNGKKELIAPPSLCPECRIQRRLAFRNERALFKRTCDATGASIVSMYPPETPFPVYHRDTWWKDGWDPLQYGKDFDFSRPFFEQFKELSIAVPRQALASEQNENSPYVNYAFHCRNCYLILGWGEECEDCHYGRLVIHDKSCVDVHYVTESELCYECSDVERCYRCIHSTFSVNCSDSWFLQNCTGCRSCFMCVNQRNKTHCFLNEQCTKEAYEERLASALQAYELQDAAWRELWTKYQSLLHTCPQKYYHGMNTEHATGDYLRDCKNAIQCFDVSHAEDVKYLVDCHDLQDCMDITLGGKNQTELAYECVNFAATHCLFCSLVWFCHDLYYCQDCFTNTSDCFGCIGLRKQKYCILNTQYTKEEYERLVPKIIEHMRSTGEYGEFFPIAISPFAYNASMAQEHFPLSREDVTKKGWQWRDQADEIPKVERTIPASELPASIDAVPDDILNWAIECEVTKRPFKIIKQELEFYRTMHLPIPHFHPDERHRRRMALRNPRKLWDRQCANCQKPIATSYSPDRPEIVYCEECYLQEVY